MAGIQLVLSHSHTEALCTVQINVEVKQVGSWQIEKQITRDLPAFRFMLFACRLLKETQRREGGKGVAIEIIVSSVVDANVNVIIIGVNSF